MSVFAATKSQSTLTVLVISKAAEIPGLSASDCCSQVAIMELSSYKVSSRHRQAQS